MPRNEYGVSAHFITPDWASTTWNSWMRSRFSASATSIMSASPRVPTSVNACSRWSVAEVLAGGEELALVLGALGLVEAAPRGIHLQEGVLDEMTLVGHARRIGLLTGLLLALVFPRADAAGMVAFVPGATLADLAARDGASVALLNTSQGAYHRTQFLLDVSQGARTSISTYRPPAVPVLDVTLDGTVIGWTEAVTRARAAPASVVPGLLGTSAGGAAFAGPRSSLPLGVAAASRAGRLEVAPVVRPGRAWSAAMAMASRHDVVFTRLSGLAELDRLLRARPPRERVLAIAQPPDGPLPGQVLPVAAFGLGGGRSLTSQTTRTDGLVSAIDIAPTLLAWDGRPIPGAMTGEPIRTGAALDLAAIQSIRDRGLVVKGRRYPALGALLGGWALLALGGLAVAGGRGMRWAVRTGALGVLWVLPVLLVTAAIAPSAPVEVAVVAVAALALGALTAALVRWPAGPLVPGAVTLAAYTVDLAFGSPLIVRSLLGSNPLGGSRFYGIGNELEALLPVLALAAVAAGASLVGTGRHGTRLAAAYAAAGVALAFVLGWSHLGADVGGVLTVGAGFAVAAVLALPGALTWRRAALALLVPVAGLVALALLDVVTGGEGHFAHLVLRSGHGQAFGDALSRRLQLAWDALNAGFMPLAAAVALALIAAGIWRRDALLAGVPSGDAWRAALAGCATVAIVGALANDSGPLLLVFATFVTAWLVAYLRADSRTGEDGSML